jgi:hypothetical protein
MILTAAALAVLSTAQPFQPLPLVPDHDMESRGIRYSGPAKINEGRYAFSAIAVQQPMAYARTAQLQSPVTVQDGLTVRKLNKGAHLFFTAGQQWCTYPAERSTEVCLKSEGGQWSWNQDYEGIDLTYPFRYVYAVCCTWQAVPKLQTVIAIRPPIMKEMVDNRTVMTAVLTLHTPSPGVNAEATASYCIPADRPYSQSSCGSSAGLDALRHTDIIYLAGGGTGARIHFDETDQLYTVSLYALE